jgi:hypothetical protein
MHLTAAISLSRMCTENDFPVTWIVIPKYLYIFFFLRGCPLQYISSHADILPPFLKTISPSVLRVPLPPYGRSHSLSASAAAAVLGL